MSNSVFCACFIMVKLQNSFSRKARFVFLPATYGHLVYVSSLLVIHMTEIAPGVEKTEWVKIKVIG